MSTKTQNKLTKKQKQFKFNELIQWNDFYEGQKRKCLGEKNLKGVIFASENLDKIKQEFAELN